VAGNSLLGDYFAAYQWAKKRSRGREEEEEQRPRQERRTHMHLCELLILIPASLHQFHSILLQGFDIKEITAF
jgi:hypothetical protein